MSILVKCKCGEKFFIDVDSTHHTVNDESLIVFIGSKKCPNLYCKLTVYVNAMITADIAEPEVTTLDWDKVKENDILIFKGHLYRIELKSTRSLKMRSNPVPSNSLMFESKKIIYLKSMDAGENVVAKVDDDGEISFIRWKDERKNTFSPDTPRTPDGYESWSEEWLASVQKELMNKTKERIIRSFNDDKI